jgi:hypothetical protein
MKTIYLVVYDKGGKEIYRTEVSYKATDYILRLSIERLGKNVDNKLVEVSRNKIFLEEFNGRSCS